MLTTSASALRKLMRKAELLGINTQVSITGFVLGMEYLEKYGIQLSKCVQVGYGHLSLWLTLSVQD